MDLINKVVKTPSIELLEYFYPNLYRTDEYQPIDGCLYTGPAQNIREFRKNGYSFIATNGMPEYDLTNKEQLLRFVYDKFNKEPPKYLLELLDLYDNEDFYRYCKETWITGKWPEKFDDTDISTFNLYQSLNRGTVEMYDTLFKLLNNMKAPVVMSQMLTFLGRVKTLEEQNASPKYMQIMRQFRDSCGRNITPSIQKYIRSKIQNNELNLVLFLNDLTSRR